MSHDNNEVAHLWAHQARSSGKGSSFYFEGDTIYSYGSHFPIARHYKGVVLFTSRGYSVSTTRHKSITLSACSHLTRFTVSNPLRDPCGQDVKEYGVEIQQKAITAAKARNPADALQSLQRAVNEANLFCTTFGFKTRFTMPDNLDELRAKAKVSAERERKAKAARQAKLEADAQDKIAQWLAGAPVSIPLSVSKTYLRALVGTFNPALPVNDGPVMQTSRGAIVPLPDAERAFRFAMIHRARGWKRNGEKFAIGNYELDAINEQGVIAGCHRVSWDEVERFAKTQGWL